MNDIHIAMAVEEVAKIISGAPFPSVQKLKKARKVVEYMWNRRFPQWQPIASVRNGDLVIFCDIDASELQNSFFVDWMVDGEFFGNKHSKATHWMPLPSAPGVGK